MSEPLEILSPWGLKLIDRHGTVVAKVARILSIGPIECRGSPVKVTVEAFMVRGQTLCLLQPGATDKEPVNNEPQEILDDGTVVDA